MFERCPTCYREQKVNQDGKIRRHWCLGEGGDSRLFALATGGTVSVRIDANWMLFGEDERALMTTMIDALRAYEARHPIHGCSEEPEADDAVGQTPNNPI